MRDGGPGIVLALVAPDIVTKAPGTRRRFTERLRANLLDALQRAGVPHAVQLRGTRFLVETAEPDAAASVLRYVFGIATVVVVEAVARAGIEDIVRVGAERFRPVV